ncbi:M20 aminoacylase family protein [Granulibacter bethesdensis]|uniref:M20 aminoacylase family protein n=1 Tax=Granulibacter bethesdensis TaxID=364410 RepID=UPI00090A1162|nr:M20 aminoacylase family protein [Granulibacter bethesdensis]APH59294.1 Metal-dependent amidase/aminoacylase/carboxypeptidase [Granulibacter bethesdensis]
MPIKDRIAAFQDEMTQWRHHLHRHPELSLEETATSAFVQQKLREFGVDEIITGIAETGVVAVIHGRAAGGTIGLRADMDALPIKEESGKPYASANPGVMHACGHDGHTAMLLGAARDLAATRNFAGTAYLIFQPAEEQIGGGRMMVEEGLFERFPMERIYGLHNWPSSPEGVFQMAPGPVMAAVANIDIIVTGKGAHGAQPQRGIDPVVVAAHIVTGLQSVVSRIVDPTDKAVLSITQIAGGNAYNVIPERVELKGTARWFTPGLGEAMEAAARGIVNGIASAFGAQVSFTFDVLYPATINDADATERAWKAASAVATTEKLPAPSMGGEDFSFMLNVKPGSYIMLGSGKTTTDPGLHHPAYDFNDAILPLGASYWVTLVEQELPLSNQPPHSS